MEEAIYQPKWCEDCKMVMGADCPLDHVPKESKGRVFHCEDKKPMREEK